jgi:hypothetical protein
VVIVAAVAAVIVAAVTAVEIADAVTKPILAIKKKRPGQPRRFFCLWM